MEDSKKLILVVTPGEEGVRLDAYCTARVEFLSRNRFQHLNEQGRVTVNSALKLDHYKVRTNDEIAITFPQASEQPEIPTPQNIPIAVVYEDDHIVVVNKPVGLVVHPAHGHADGTLVNALLGRGMRLAPQGVPLRPGVVHRLDKDTSGLMVLAKSAEAYDGLAKQLKENRMKKIYHAIIWGNLGRDEWIVDLPVGRHPVQRQKMTVLKKGGKEALTRIFVVDSFLHFQYIRIVLDTGRTHQIRVHLQGISHPILGDPVYGGRRRHGGGESSKDRHVKTILLKIMQRQALHASVLSFLHPISGESMRLKSALPGDISQALETLYCKDTL